MLKLIEHVPAPVLECIASILQATTLNALHHECGDAYNTKIPIHISMFYITLQVCDKLGRL